MTPLSIVLIVFLTLFFLRVPIAAVLISSTVVGIFVAPDNIPISTLPTTMWQGINHFVLLAIPFLSLIHI